MEKAKPVRVFSSKELAREMQQIHDNLSNVENNWSVRISSMKRLEGLVLGGSLQFDNFHSLLKSLIIPLTLQLSDRRSSIIRQVCHLLGFLAEELTTSFEFAVEIFIPALLKLVVITIQIIAETADQCIKKLIVHCKISRLLPVLIDTSTKDRSPMIRIRCSNYVLMVLRQWHHATELQKNPELFESFIKGAVVDALSEVRANGRVCFQEFSNVWPERSKKLFSVLEFSAQKIILDEGYKNQDSTHFKLDISSQRNYNSGTSSPKQVRQIQQNGSQNGLYPRSAKEEDKSVKIINRQNPVSESQSDSESFNTDDSGHNKVEPDLLTQKDDDSKEKADLQNDSHGTNKEVLTVKLGSVNDSNYDGGRRNGNSGDKHIHSNGVKLEENISRKNNGLLDFFGALSNFKNKIFENENDENAVNNSSPSVRTLPLPEKTEPEVKEVAIRIEVSATTEQPSQDQAQKFASDFKIKSKINTELRSEVEFEIGEGLKAANVMLDFTSSSKFLNQIQLSVSSFLSQLKSNNIDQASKIFSSLAKVMPPCLPTLHLTDDVEKANVLHEFLSLGIRVKVVVDDVVSIGGLDDQECHAMSRGTYNISSLLSGEPMDNGKVMILWQRNKARNNQDTTNYNQNAVKSDSDYFAESNSAENMNHWCIEWCMWNSDLPENLSSFLFPICSPSPSNPPLSPPRSLPSPRLSPRPTHSSRISPSMVSPNRRLSSPLPSSFASPDSARKKLSHSSPEFWGYVPDNVKVKSLKSKTFVQSRTPSSIPHTTNGGTNTNSSERKLSRSCSSSPLMSSIPPPSSSPSLKPKSKSRYTHERRSYPADSTSIPNLASYFSQNTSNSAEVWLVS